MTAPATVDRTAELERKLDVLTDHVRFLTEEAEAQRRRREAFEELQVDVMPLATRALERTSSSLDDADIDPEQVLQLGVRIAQNADTLERSVAQLASLAELASDLQPILGQLVETMVARAAEFEQRGYFEFVEATAGVVDRVVTSYSKDDVEALGDNVVQILDIVKDLTQPEVLAVAQRLLDAVHRQAELEAATQTDPPSLFALAGRLRDPEIRRGMGRALDTLQAVAATQEPDHETIDDTQGGA